MNCCVYMYISAHLYMNPIFTGEIKTIRQISILSVHQNKDIIIYVSIQLNFLNISKVCLAHCGLFHVVFVIFEK
jgi:hypothetical protein